LTDEITTERVALGNWIEEQITGVSLAHESAESWEEFRDCTVEFLLDILPPIQHLKTLFQGEPLMLHAFVDSISEYADSAKHLQTERPITDNTNYGELQAAEAS